MLILTDRVYEAKRIQSVLQALRPCAIASIQQALSLPPVFSTIICDVTFATEQSFQIVKAALLHYRANPNVSVLFLLRDPSILSQEQARMAGTTATLTYPASNETLLTAVRDLGQDGGIANSETSINAALASAAESTIATLANIFGSSTRRRPIKVAEVEKGGDLLLQAIRGIKIQSWLDKAFNYDDLTYQH